MLPQLSSKKYLLAFFTFFSLLAVIGAVVSQQGLLTFGFVGLVAVLFLLQSKVYSYVRRATDRSLRMQQQHERRLTDLASGILRSSPKENLQTIAKDEEPAKPTEDITHGLGQRGPRPSDPFGFGPDYYYGEKHRRDVRVLESIAMKFSSISARNPIALNATGLHLGLDQLLMFARGLESGVIQERYLKVAKSWDPRSLASLARVLADQSLRPADVSDAVCLYSLILRSHGAGSLDSRARLIYVESLQALGRFERAEELISTFSLAENNSIQATLLRCNGIMSLEGGYGNIPDRWIQNLNTMYEAGGLSPIAAIGGDPTDVLSRVGATSELIKAGPLVSVIMPTRNGSDRIGVAMRAVLGQSWHNLELIIVDDASDGYHWDKLVEMAAESERVRLVRLDVQQGAYRARNYGLQNASGEFVTVHDDDDWSHPQKIEIQVRHLLEHSSAPANMTYQTRINRDGLFLRINDNPEFNQKNYSSLLIRVSDLKKLGGWGDLNRGADAEFHDRIAAVTGTKVVGLLTPPLSFTKAREGSLTSGEIRKGALDFARQTLGLTYPVWHSRLQTGQTPLTSGDPVPYPVPSNMLPREGALLESIDVVFITDYRFKGGNSSLIAAEIAAAATAGLRVAVAQMDSPVLRSRPPMNETVYDVLQEHSIPVVTITDPLEVSLVVLRHPSILQYADNIRSGFRPQRVAVIVNNAPMGTNGSDAIYDLEACVINGGRLFGIVPEIFPESQQTRKVLDGLFPGTDLADGDWPGFIDHRQYLTARDVSEQRKPVVGRHSRDHVLKWPDRKTDLLDVYVRPDDYETRVLGGADSIKSRFGDLGSLGVTVYPFGAVDPHVFLKDVDFWVYFHSDSLVESFGMSIVEAMASGAVVILPEYMEPMFGAGALYCEPKDVAGIVNEYWNDRQRYMKQSSMGVATVEGLYSVAAYQDRIIQYLDDSKGAAVTRVRNGG